MLSYEERKAIENLKIEYEKLMKEDNILFPLYKSNAKRLIDLIEKQSKEIEELKDKCKELIFEKQELTSALLDSTPNDKIKAKMEELDNPLSETFKSLLNAEEPTWSGTIKQFLQSLLEKE